MNTLRKILAYLAAPPKLIYALTFIFAPVFIGLAIFFAAVGSEGIFAYISYALAALFLGYATFLIIKNFNSLRVGTANFIRSIAPIRVLLDNFDLRTLLLAASSTLINVLYAVFNGVIAIIYRSPWYGSLAAYYIFLSLLRVGNVLIYRRRELLTERKRVISRYLFTGILLTLLPICLSFSILQMVRDGTGYEYPGLMIYATAAYAFYKITVSTVNLIKRRRTDDLTLRALGSVGLADSLVSILALQTALLTEFGDGTGAELANALTGAGISLVLLLIGISMLITAKKEYEKVKDGDGRKEQ